MKGLETSPGYQTIRLYNADVDAAEDVGTIDCRGMNRIGCEVLVAGAALTAFVIQARFNADGSYQTLFSSAADFNTPQGVLVGASGDLTTQGVGSGWFIMDVSGIESLKIRAAGTSSVLTILGGGQ